MSKKGAKRQTPNPEELADEMADEIEKQNYYSALAEFEMQVPRVLPEKLLEKGIEQRDLKKFCEQVDLSLRARFDGQNVIEGHIDRLLHLTHLYFNGEKLEHESKFDEQVEARYISHRSVMVQREKKYIKLRFYTFEPIGCSVGELVLNQSVAIDGNKGMIFAINQNSGQIEIALGIFGAVSARVVEFEKNVCYPFEVDFNSAMQVAFVNSLRLLAKGHGQHATFPEQSHLLASRNEFENRLQIFEQNSRSTDTLQEFNEQQRKAIFAIASGVHVTIPYIVWGPPGTGKTVTIAEAIRRILHKNEHSRVLVCTPSNNAADLIARRILAKNVLNCSQLRRYYSQGKSVNDRDRELDKIIKTKSCPYSGVKFGFDTFHAISSHNVRLIFCTLGCSHFLRKKSIAEEDFFTHIFIDEAGQSIEPETLLPITNFSTPNTRIILSGDHQQLGPVIKAHFLKNYTTCIRSLMERLVMDEGKKVYSDGRTFCQLTDSYRCHPAIIKFSSDNFYKGTLRAMMERERSSFIGWRHLPNKNFPLVCHLVSKGSETREDEGRSYHNTEEAEVVLKYIRLLQRTMEVRDEDIGVISPYKEQTSRIRKELRGRKITVDSIECYQGSERRVIILTLSRSSQIGFLAEYKRMNTSFTRAQELLIVVASLQFVNKLDPMRNYWTAFFHYCRENQAIVIDNFSAEDNGELSDQFSGLNISADHAEGRKAKNDNGRRLPSVGMAETREKLPMSVVQKQGRNLNLAPFAHSLPTPAAPSPAASPPNQGSKINWETAIDGRGTFGGDDGPARDRESMEEEEDKGGERLPSGSGRPWLQRMREQTKAERNPWPSYYGAADWVEPAREGESRHSGTRHSYRNANWASTGYCGGRATHRQKPNVGRMGASLRRNDTTAFSDAD